MPISDVMIPNAALQVEGTAETFNSRSDSALLDDPELRVSSSLLLVLRSSSSALELIDSDLSLSDPTV